MLRCKGGEAKCGGAKGRGYTGGNHVYGSKNRNKGSSSYAGIAGIETRARGARARF